MTNATAQSKELRELKSELKHLASVVKKNINHANTNAATPFGIDTAEVTRIARQAGEDLRAYVDAKKERATDFYHEGEEMVAANPMKSLAIAAGVGFALSALLAGLSRTRH